MVLYRIACAKVNPQADMIGIDTWKKEYDSFSRKLCERNAKAEHIENACFMHELKKIGIQKVSFIGR